MSDGSPMPRGLYTGPDVVDSLRILASLALWSLRQIAKYSFAMFVAGFVFAWFSPDPIEAVDSGLATVIGAPLYGGFGFGYLAHLSFLLGIRLDRVRFRLVAAVTAPLAVPLFLLAAAQPDEYVLLPALVLVAHCCYGAWSAPYVPPELPENVPDPAAD